MKQKSLRSMKTKINKTVVSILVITMTLLLGNACNKSQDKPKEEKTSLNPNGDSELAIVMRTMMESCKKMKSEIEGNLPLSPYPETIKTITTATPTDGMIDDRNVFNGFANFHLAALDSMYLPQIDAKVQFNHLVKSCVDCHENYCHGPIPAIKKLYISAK